MTKEEIYDTEIAPKLLKIAKLCEKHKLGFAAAVEYEPFGLGRTVTYPADCSVAIRMVDWAVQSHGNVDSLIWGICRWAREKGHSSANLHILGIPEEPVWICTECKKPRTDESPEMPVCPTCWDEQMRKP